MSEFRQVGCPSWGKARVADRDAEPAGWEVESFGGCVGGDFGNAVVDATVGAAEDEEVAAAQLDVEERCGAQQRSDRQPAPKLTNRRRPWTPGHGHDRAMPGMASASPERDRPTRRLASAPPPGTARPNDASAPRRGSTERHLRRGQHARRCAVALARLPPLARPPEPSFGRLIPSSEGYSTPASGNQTPCARGLWCSSHHVQQRRGR